MQVQECTKAFFKSADDIQLFLSSRAQMTIALLNGLTTGIGKITSEDHAQTVVGLMNNIEGIALLEMHVHDHGDWCKLWYDIADAGIKGTDSLEQFLGAERARLQSIAEETSRKADSIRTAAAQGAAHQGILDATPAEDSDCDDAGMLNIQSIMASFTTFELPGASAGPSSGTAKSGVTSSVLKLFMLQLGKTLYEVAATESGHAQVLMNPYAVSKDMKLIASEANRFIRLHLIGPVTILPSTDSLRVCECWGMTFYTSSMVGKDGLTGAHFMPAWLAER